MLAPLRLPVFVLLSFVSYRHGRCLTNGVLVVLIMDFDHKNDMSKIIRYFITVALSIIFFFFRSTQDSGGDAVSCAFFLLVTNTGVVVAKYRIKANNIFCTRKIISTALNSR